MGYQFNVRSSIYSKDLQIGHRTYHLHISLYSSYAPLFVFYRSGNSIRHFKIFDEGGRFKIGDMTFDSMVGLVDYFKEREFHEGTKLEFPINEEILRQKVS